MSGFRDPRAVNVTACVPYPFARRGGSPAETTSARRPRGDVGPFVPGRPKIAACGYADEAVFGRQWGRGV